MLPDDVSTAIYDALVIDDAVVAAIDATVRSEMERSRQPGVSLGLTDCDRTLAIRTYGFADLASRHPVTPEVLFEIGSIGKSFTAIAILQLVDEGRIDLDAAVERYLPWFVVDRRGGDAPITVRHLLSHTSGIVAGVDATPEATFQVWSLRDLPTYSVPGERFHYSNVGYKVLGLVLEAVEGRPYREILRDRVLKPVGMQATEPVITHEIEPGWPSATRICTTTGSGMRAPRWSPQRGCRSQRQMARSRRRRTTCAPSSESFCVAVKVQRDAC